MNWAEVSSIARFGIIFKPVRNALEKLLDGALYRSSNATFSGSCSFQLPIELLHFLKVSVRYRCVFLKGQISESMANLSPSLAAIYHALADLNYTIKSLHKQF